MPNGFGAVEDAAAQSVAAVAALARAADRLVQGDQRVGNVEYAAVFVRDGTALTGRARGAGPADGPVTEKRAAGDISSGSHGHGEGGGSGDEVGDRPAPADLRWCRRRQPRQRPGCPLTCCR